jgi:hypothetical protein
MPWQPQAIAFTVALILVGSDTVPFVVATILLSTAAGFALDDPAHELTAASATPLLRRRLRRVVIVVTPTTAVWAGLAAWQGTEGADETWALSLMFFGLTGLSLGIAGSVGRRSNGRGGQVVAPTVLVLLILSSIARPRWRPMPLGDIPGGWPQIHLRWGIVGLVGIVAFLVSSRDPARN